MPEFIIPAEADRCPHCGEILRDPPKCCEAMVAEHNRELALRLEGLPLIGDGWPDVELEPGQVAFDDDGPVETLNL